MMFIIILLAIVYSLGVIGGFINIGYEIGMGNNDYFILFPFVLFWPLLLPFLLLIKLGIYLSEKKYIAKLKELE